MVYKFFDKKLPLAVLKMRIFQTSNQQKNYTNQLLENLRNEKYKSITITNAFQKILKESNRKPNKIWVNKDRKFYNSPMKSSLEGNKIEMYSMHNEGKSFVA